MGHPELSIIIPHYGDAADTGGLVRSLANQSPPPQEILVVDDCSPTPFALSSADTDEFDYSSVTVLRHWKNMGFGAAVNTGARVAHGEVLIVLNSDVTISETFIIDVLHSLGEHSGALIAPEVLGGSGRASWACRKFPTLFGQFLQHIRIVTGIQCSETYQSWCGMDVRQWRTAEALEAEWVAGVVLIIPREIFQAVGGFRREYHMYFEEVDLQRTLQTMRVRRIYDPQISVSHEGGVSSDPERVAAWEMRSRFAYAHRWGHPHPLAALLVSAATVNTFLDAVRKLRGKDVRPLYAWWTQVRIVRGAWRSTRSIPSA